jgi:hypothetical protein
MKSSLNGFIRAVLDYEIVSDGPMCLLLLSCIVNI